MLTSNLFLVRFPTLLSFLKGFAFDAFDPDNIVEDCKAEIKATIENYENWNFVFVRPEGIEDTIQDLYKLLFWVNQNEGVAKMHAQQWYREEKAEAMNHVPEERERECHHLGWKEAVAEAGPGYVW